MFFVSLSLYLYILSIYHKMLQYILQFAVRHIAFELCVFNGQMCRSRLGKVHRTPNPWVPIGSNTG